MEYDYEKLKEQLEAYVKWFEYRYNFTNLEDSISTVDWQLYLSAKAFLQ